MAKHISPRLPQYDVPQFEGGLAPEDIFTLLGGRLDPLIVEVGCNDGEDTDGFLKMCPWASVTCFECDPRAIRQFKARDLSGKYPQAKITLHETAVSDQVGHADLRMSGGTTKHAKKKDWDMSSSLLDPKEHLQAHPWCTFNRTERVATTTLQDWADFEQHNGRDAGASLLWIDVQGAEYLVFKGANRGYMQSMVDWCYFEFDEREMYASQKKLPELLSLVPDFDLVAIYFHYGVPNALVSNRNLRPRRRGDIGIPK